jgi:hypothetical protein
MGVVPQPDYKTDFPFQLYKYFFNVNTEGLAAGLSVLNPDPGTVILDAFITCEEAFNATTVADLVFASAEDNIQTISVETGAPTSGNLIVDLAGVASGNIAWDATTATVQAAIQAMSNVGAGNALVTGSTGGPWTVAFVGALADQEIPLMTINNAGVVGGTFGVSNTDSGIFAKLGSGAVSLTSASTQYGASLQSLSDENTKLEIINPPQTLSSGVVIPKSLLLVVNQTGLPGGAASTATQGEASLFLAVAQPISLNPTDIPLPLN